MVAFLLGCLVLFLGYHLYGRFVESTVDPDPTRATPALSRPDGMDYVAMPTWRVWLVQLLNIAGLGPVFGPIMGALWGPQVFLWVVIGCVFGGAVHDFLSGAMSVRAGGAGLPTLIGHYLGPWSRRLARVFILILMVLVGTVFVKGPALLIVQLIPAETVGNVFGADEFLSSSFSGQGVWLWLVMIAIFGYYIVATMLPIDKIIGRVYPILALALLVMVGGLTAAILSGKLKLIGFTLANLHPSGAVAWPVIFITVSCGAVSGFHATQAPLMARCLRNESSMRRVFYGTMIAEGAIALVWAGAASGYYGSTEALSAVVIAGGPGQVVHEVCTAMMGTFGGVLAVLGVVVLPITSGDTAFRVGRLIVADGIGLDQRRTRNRYVVALPLFAAAVILNFVDFTLIWRYFGWANQALAAVTLWTGTVFLARRGRKWWIAAVPAVFMTVMTTTYILVEERGLALNLGLGTGIGISVGLMALVAFLILRPERGSNGDDVPPPPVKEDPENVDGCQIC